MTGWLAATGIVLVLVASLYAGLNATSPSDTAAERSGPTTPLRDASPAEPALPEPTSTPQAAEAEPTAEPAPVNNRQNCDQIRGTQYISPEERTWYLANCVRQ